MMNVSYFVLNHNFSQRLIIYSLKVKLLLLECIAVIFGRSHKFLNVLQCLYYFLTRNNCHDIEISF
jgi:hypothetical protein